MAVITAAMVKALREKTDAPMMECKKALTEAEGDAAKAEEILRVKLGNKASKAAARVTAEGVVAVYIAPDAKTAAILEVNSETDFVAKNPEFQQMAADAAKLIAEQNPADVAALAALEVNGQTLEAVRKNLVGKIGENMTFRRFKRLEAKGALHQYVHGGSKIAALVDVVGGDDELAHDIAMHIAAAKPTYVRREEVDADKLAKEAEIQRAKAIESGKPEKIVDRIVAGQIEKYYKEVCLLDQQFVKDGDKTITSLMNETAKAAGTTLDIVRYVRFERGEGIEKRKDDLAAEIAAMKKA